MNNRPLTFFETQRRALGVTDDLQTRPVLYISVHRGDYDGSIPEHVKGFVNALGGKASRPQENIAVDLSEGLPIGFRELLEGFLERSHGDDVEMENKKPPGHILNLIYLPPLDESGQSKGPSVTYALDQKNFQRIFDKFEHDVVESFPTRDITGVEPLRDDHWYSKLADCLPSLDNSKK